MPLSNRWQRCLVGYLVIFCFCQTIAKNLPDSCNDRKNYLWREECHFTGDRQGPIFDRKQKNITHHSPPQPIFSSILNGGSLDISSRSEEDTTEVTPYDRVFQWRRKRGKITINLGEPKEEETITVRTVLLGTVDSATAANQTATVVVPLTQQLEPSPHDPCNQNIEIALSIEPSSCVRLVQTSANASVVFFSAFAVTLRLLAPMIVARKLLATLGYICYDRYYGRYLRTTYNNKLKHLEEYEIISGLRACGRITVQLLAMGVVGKSLIIILDHSPCFMAPRICELWYALVWIVGVLVAARVADAGVSLTQ